MWLSKEHLTVEYGDDPLSQYAVGYQPDDKHLRDIREPRHFATRYRTPQLDLWQTDAVEWHLVKRMPDYAKGDRSPIIPSPTFKSIINSEFHSLQLGAFGRR